MSFIEDKIATLRALLHPSFVHPKAIQSRVRDRSDSLRDLEDVLMGHRRIDSNFRIVQSTSFDHVYKFTPDGLLGRGRSGAVREAIHCVHGGSVAVKTLATQHSEIWTNEEFQLLLNEVAVGH